MDRGAWRATTEWLTLGKCMNACMLSLVRLFATLWAVAHQAPLSMGFPRQEYWNGLPFSSPGDIPDPGIELTSPEFPACAGRLFTTEPITIPWAWEASQALSLMGQRSSLSLHLQSLNLSHSLSAEDPPPTSSRIENPPVWRLWTHFSTYFPTPQLCSLGTGGLPPSSWASAPPSAPLLTTTLTPRGPAPSATCPSQDHGVSRKRAGNRPFLDLVFVWLGYPICSFSPPSEFSKGTLTFRISAKILHRQTESQLLRAAAVFPTISGFSAISHSSYLISGTAFKKFSQPDKLSPALTLQIHQSNGCFSLRTHLQTLKRGWELSCLWNK